MSDLISELEEALVEEPELYPEALEMMARFAQVQRGLCDDDEVDEMLREAQEELSSLANRLDGEMGYCD